MYAIAKPLSGHPLSLTGVKNNYSPSKYYEDLAARGGCQLKHVYNPTWYEETCRRGLVAEEIPVGERARGRTSPCLPYYSQIMYKL